MQRQRFSCRCDGRTFVSLIVSSALSQALALTGSAAFAAPPPSPKGVTKTATQSVADLQKIIAQGQLLEGEGRLPEALRIYEDILRHGSGTLESSTLLEMHEHMAALYEQCDDLVAAQASRTKILAITKATFGPKDWHVTSAQLALADTEHLSHLTPAQRSRLRDAEQLNSQLLQAGGNPRFTIDLAARALKIRNDILGRRNLKTATSLGNLASLQQQLANYDAAGKNQEEALAITQQLLGDLHPMTAATRLNLSDLYRARGLYIQSKPLAEQALRVFQATMPANEPIISFGQSTLGSICKEMGEYRKAEALFKEALRMRLSAFGPVDTNTATSLNNLGTLYQAMGDYVQAEAFLKRAEDSLKNLDIKDDPRLIGVQNNLGMLYVEMADYAKAEPLLYNAWDGYAKRFGAQYPDTLGFRCNLGVLYQNEGQYTKAEDAFQEVLNVPDGPGHPNPHRAASYAGLGLIQEAMGDYVAAEDSLQRAADLCVSRHPRHPKTAVGLSDLATLYDATGKFQKAEELYRQAIDIQKDSVDKSSVAAILTRTSLAGVYLHKGDYPTAKEMLVSVVADMTLQHPGRASALNGLGIIEDVTGESGKAEKLYREALAIQKDRRLEWHPLYAQTLNNLGILMFWSRGAKEAEPFVRQSVTIMQRAVAQSFGAISERRQLAYATASRAYLDSYLSIGRSAEVPASQIYRFVLLQKAAVTLQQALTRLQRRQPKLTDLFQKFETVNLRLANLMWLGPHGAPEKVLPAIEKLQIERDALQAGLTRSSAEFAEIKDSLELSPNQWRKFLDAIPPKGALVDVVEYTNYSPLPLSKGAIRGERQFVAFVVRSSGDVVQVDLGPAAPIAALIEHWRGHAVDAEYKAEGGDDLKSLRGSIWTPLEPYLGDSETVLYSPDGCLCQFPISVVPGKARKSHLIDERAVVVIPVPRLLPFLSARRLGQVRLDPLLLFGDADPKCDPGIVTVERYQSALVQAAKRRQSNERANLDRLPGFKEEIDQIGKLFQERFGEKAQVINGVAATEGCFRAQAPRFRTVHMAVHGVYDPAAEYKLFDDQPRPFGDLGQVRRMNPDLFSWIALAGAEKGIDADRVKELQTNQVADDGRLTAMEVEGLDLNDVEMIVVSGCQTGRGLIATGEGVLGLQRAFQIAGAKSAVTTLWRVNDKVTAALMIEFYRSLWGHKHGNPTTGRLEALRQAQRTIMREYDYNPQTDTLRKRGDSNAGSDFEHCSLPYYWAGFVLSGDWR
jgi:CHAT domain-containing protein/tetratricopeptide (TPR) repeat protein